MSDLIRVIDFETTRDPAAPLGLPIGQSERVIEVGWTDLRKDGDAPGGWRMQTPRSRFIDPNMTVAPEYSAIHHIIDADLVGAPKFGDVASELAEGEPLAYAAHFAKYEQNFFAVSTPWICTYKLALRLWPDAPNHKLQTLRYFLGLKVDRAIADQSHRAGPDTYVCARLLKVIMLEFSLDECFEISRHPAILPRLGFGEHAEKPLNRVPQSYLEWILNDKGKREPFNEDIKATAFNELKLRRTQPKQEAAS